MHTPQHTKRHNQAVAQPNGIATVLVTLRLLCVVLALTLSSAPSIAEGGASNRKEAISQALSMSGSDAEVLGVKTMKNKNGRVVFAIKIISNGRVKVINIPKLSSE